MSDRASELKDLDVDRVDGVDRPATGRNFLLFKSVDGVATVSKSEIMKGYGATATAAAIVLKSLRTDKSAQFSRKSAIALNGLAQILGQDAVVVDKSVPTQPYEIKEDVDGDKRGPADENLGGNFSPRSMPGSMVGSVQFRMKDDDEDVDDAKVSGKAKAAYDDDEEDAKAKAAAKLAKAKAKQKDADADDDADDDDMDASEKSNRGIARAAKFEASVASAVAKALVEMGLAAPVTKVQKAEDEAQPVRKTVVSRQVQADEKQDVRKDSGLRMGVSFSDIAFSR